MADENKGNTPEQGTSAPELTNVKAEFNRKIDNVGSKLASLEESNKALMAHIQALSQAGNAAQNSANKGNLKEKWFDAPEEAAEMLAGDIENRISKKIEARDALIVKQNQTLSKLVSDYPELSNSEHEMTKRAVEIYNAMPKDEQSNPAGYKAAVREAASELGIVVKSKRSDDIDADSDNFSISGGNNTRSSVRNRKGGSGAVDPAAEELARLFGLDIDNDKALKERIRTNHGRKSWNKWE